MSTLIATKEGFLKMLGEQIDDNAIVAFTQDIHGQLGITDKGRVKSVPFGFSSEVFKRKETVGDIMKRDVMAIGIIIMPPEHASEVAKELYKTKGPEDNG